MVNRDKIIGGLCGFVLTILLISCVSASFPYKYYEYDISSHKLLGDAASNDLDDLICESRTGNRFPCMVVLTEDFFNLKSDYLKTKEALIRCEKR